MRYLSVCSGIEAATVAWHQLGWTAAAFSEIEAFPRSVLAHHYPDVPCHGDFTTIGADEYGPVDLLVGGTPCQSFSVAGLRGGLGDYRGNLALEYLRLADRTRPRWLVWENVPGVLSSNGGRDFGAILGGMVELGYGFAYRILDAQFAGVPQRRRRVFVVGHLGDWRRAAAVLFERHSLSGDTSPRREKGQRVADSLTVGANQCSGFPGDFTHDVAPTIPSRSTGGGGLGTDFDCDGGLVTKQWPAEVAPALDTTMQKYMGYDNQHVNGGCGWFVPNTAHSLRGEGFDASEDGTGRGTSLVPVCFSAKDHGADAMHDLSPTLQAGGHSGSHANAGVMPAVAQSASAVRRLTPRECERLQGFPDEYTLVPHRGKPAADGPRYKALGNSMAVPCMAYIGQRIAAVESSAILASMAA